MMSNSTTISPLSLFQQLFPDHRLIYNYPDELKYGFASPDAGRIYERVANRLILKKKLAIVTELKIWHVGGRLREVALFIKPAPEEHLIMDDVPGESIEPDWWTSKERE